MTASAMGFIGKVVQRRVEEEQCPRCLGDGKHVEGSGKEEKILGIGGRPGGKAAGENIWRMGELPKYNGKHKAGMKNIEGQMEITTERRESETGA